MVAPVWVAAALLVAVADAGAPLTIPLKEYLAVFEQPAPPPSVPGQKRRRRKVHVTEYYGQVSFGNPPQPFDMVFDTGSGNIVLPTAKCFSEPCTRHRRFQSVLSNTAVQIADENEDVLQPGQSDRDTTTITYGTGQLTGEYVRDNVCMGSNTSGGARAACVTSDFLGVTTESRMPFIELPFDGIFGLGLQGLSAGENFNFVNRLKQNSDIRPIFAVFLRNLKADEDSELTFGSFRRERLAEDLHWLPIPKDEAEENGYWLVTMRDVDVRGQKLNLCGDPGANPRCKVAMDTGSSLMMGSPSAVSMLLSAIALQDDCSNLKQLPDLRFIMDASAGEAYELVLTPDDYVDQSDEGCATTFQAIELPPELSGMWIFGQTILRKYYTVYDASTWRVGVGLAKHSAKRRWEPLPPKPPHPAVPVEACVNDDASMKSSQLPGCVSFQQMGYCTRFASLGQHYCRRACNLCHDPTTGANSTTNGSATSVTRSPTTPSPRMVRSKSSGFAVAREERQVFLSQAQQRTPQT